MKDDEDTTAERAIPEHLDLADLLTSQGARENSTLARSVLESVRPPSEVNAIKAASLSKSYTSSEILAAAAAAAAIRPIASAEVLKAAALAHSLRSHELINATMLPLKSIEALRGVLPTLDRLEALKSAMQPIGNFAALQAVMTPTISSSALQAAAIAIQTFSPSFSNAAEASMRISNSPDAWKAAAASVQSLGSLSGMKAAMAALRPLASFELLKSAKIESLSESLKSVVGFADLALRPSASLKTMVEEFQALQHSPIFAALAATDPEKIQSLVNYAKTQGAESAQSLIREVEGYDFRDPASNDSAARDEVIRTLEDESKARTLSPQAWMLLLRIWMILSTLYTGISMWNDFREGLCDIDARVSAAESFPHARKELRKALCGLPSELTDSVRLAAGENVNLRKQPGMKAEVILTMRSFAVLEVVDSDNRDWLLVRYKHEDVYIEGWVSRKFVNA